MPIFKTAFFLFNLITLSVLVAMGDWLSLVGLVVFSLSILVLFPRRIKCLM